MGDYFAALAARTLRPELSVQPRQRVRWNEVPEPMADAFPAAAATIAAGAQSSVPDGGEPPRRSRRTSTAESSQPEREPAAPRPSQRGRRKGAGDEDAATPAMASTPDPTVRAVEPAVHVRFERVAARPGDAPGKSAAIAGDRAAAAVRSSSSGDARPLPARLLAREREPASEPAIRIHIGRVDVRAVTAAAPGSPPASRDSTRAPMSLDEYVQKRDRGAS